MHSEALPSILVVAAEASSSFCALRLLQHWKATGVPVRAFGVGSREMEQEGFEVLGRSEDMAVVGLQEVLGQYRHIRSVFRRLLEEVERRRPPVALLLDYAEFNLRLARRLKKMGVPVVYYISPKVWVWRQSRVHTIRATVDKMLVVFGFEKDFYDGHRVPVEFVGHPLLDELSDSLFDAEAIAARRAAVGLSRDGMVLALMPGSRRSELRHHLAVQVATARRLRAQFPALEFVLPVAPTLTEEEVRTQLGECELPIALVRDDPFEMIALADVALTASGTATLMVGLLERPMVIMYRMSRLTEFIGRFIVKPPAHFGLINLILGERAVPELFQDEVTPERMAGELSPMIESEERRRAIREKLGRARALLGNRGATERVARALRPYLKAR